jgi:acetyltransferase-like isoleucine patch superfamily enzyme
LERVALDGLLVPEADARTTECRQDSSRRHRSGSLHGLINWACAIVEKVGRRSLVLIHRPLFKACGKNFRFDPFGQYTYDTISVGDDVSLGWRPILMAAKSEIRIGNKVIFGPQVVLIGGGHNTSVVGRFMHDVTEKRPTDDLGVTIEDDVWIGCRAIVLRGVTVGRGSVVGAGSVVTKDVPPYAVVAGNPARVLKFRWDVETILRHEEELYPPECRLSRRDLEGWRDR